MNLRKLSLILLLTLTLLLAGCQSSNNTGDTGSAAVSYTHLDVYKRQAHEDDEAPEAIGGVEGEEGFLQQGEHTVEEDLPDVTQDDAADKVGHKKYRAENVGALDGPGQSQGDGKGDHIDEQRRNNGKGGAEEERLAEALIGEGIDIVFQTVPGGVVNGDELAEGQVQSLKKGIDKRCV